MQVELHSNQSPKFATSLLKSLLHQAEQLECKSEVLQLVQLIGTILEKEKRFEEAHAIYQRTLTKAQEQGDKAAIAQLNYLQGNLYYEQKNYKYALSAFSVGLIQAQQVDSLEQAQANLNIRIGDTYSQFNDYVRALGFYQKALDIALAMNNNILAAKAYNNLAVGYREQSNYTKAIFYFREAIKNIASENSAPLLTFEVNLNLGNSLRAIQQYEEAESTLLQALKLATSMNSNKNLGIANMMLGALNIDTQDFGEAEQYLKEAERRLEVENDEEELSLVYQYLGKLYLLKKDWTIAEMYLEESIKKITGLDYSLEFDLIQSYELLSTLYFQQGKYELAYTTFNAYKTISDTIYEQTHNQTLEHQKQIFDDIQKKRETDALLREVELKTTLTWSFAAVALLLVAVLFLAFRSTRVQKQANGHLQRLNHQISEQKQAIEKANNDLLAANRELEQSNDRLLHFVHSISHDLKGPLGNLMGFMELLAVSVQDKVTLDEAQYLEYMEQSSLHIYNLLQDLKTYTELGQNLPPAQPVCLDSLIQTVEKDYRLEILKSGAQIVTLPMPIVKGHSTLLLQLFQNLIDNSLKYKHADQQPYIQIGTFKENDTTIFFVKDNGVGIDNTKIAQIFDMFSRAHTDEFSGSGMGLAICKRIVEVYGGSIWAESELGKGTTIFFTLPAMPIEQPAPLSETAPMA